MENQNEKTLKMPEEVTTVGMFLRYTRLNQKKNMETVAKALCIRKVYIKAIEESDFTELQPVPYGIGFVRSYAEYLGLNSDRVVQCYKEEAMPKKVTDTAKSIIPTQKITIMPNRRHILIGIAAVVLLYSVWLIMNGRRETIQESTEMAAEEMLYMVADAVSADETAAEADAGEVLSQAEDEETLKTADETLDKISADESSLQTTDEVVKPADEQIKVVEDKYYEDPVEPKDEPKARVVVKFNGESWFQIRDAKKVYISGVFQKGFEYVVPDMPGLEFSVGRYYNVDVYIDGKLTQVAQPNKQTKINLDDFLNH